MEVSGDGRNDDCCSHGLMVPGGKLNEKLDAGTRGRLRSRSRRGKSCGERESASLVEAAIHNANEATRLRPNWEAESWFA